MTTQTLTLRQLNRATLARQMLLQREAMPVTAAVERLVGLQAQLPAPPYFGLWSRLNGFAAADLARLIADRAIIKATWIRATLHLCTAADYEHFRTALQPALTQAWAGIAKRRAADFDLDALLAAARAYIAETPRTFAEISDWLTGLMPDHDVGAMRYAVRTHLPLVQVPISGRWSYSSRPQFTLAESWTGRAISAEDDLPGLLRRYLAAFGPASVTDMQTWSGFRSLKETVERLRPELHVYRDEARRELFDLPGLPLPPADQPAPPRFLPEFDNLLLSHKDRRRVIADEHRSRVFLPGLRVSATILVDGFVRGAWKIEKAKGAAVLLIEPFAPITEPDLAALVEQGEHLLRFAEPSARSFQVRFAGSP